MTLFFHNSSQKILPNTLRACLVYVFENAKNNVLVLSGNRSSPLNLVFYVFFINK